jgi:hypothetical protein
VNVRVDESLQRRRIAKFLINKLQSAMNKAMLQDHLCLVVAQVPEAISLLFLRCGFTKLSKHQEKRQVKTILDAKRDHIDLVWQKNTPMTKSLTEIVNGQIEEACKVVMRRFREETVNANKRAFEEIFSNS